MEMANIESNIDEVEAWLDSIVASVDFSRPGSEGSLGEDIAGIIAQGIIDRTISEQKDSAGGPLKANEPKYAAYKKKRYQAHQPLVRTGQMLSLESVSGETSITSDAIEMTYGTGKAPDRTSTGVPLAKSDAEVTDREKAEHTSEERLFYGLDEPIADAVMDHAEQWLENEIP